MLGYRARKLVSKALSHFFSSSAFPGVDIIHSYVPNESFTLAPVTQRDCKMLFVGISTYGSALTDSLFVDNKTVAKVLLAVAHEARHIYQLSYMYTGASAAQNWDMFRMTAATGAFRGSYWDTYKFCLDELDADIHGLIAARDYANANVSRFDFESTIVDAINDAPGEFHDIEHATSFDDVITQLQSMQLQAKDRLRSFAFDDSEHDRIICDFIQTNCPGWLSDKNMPDPRSGLEFDEWLFAVMLDCDTSFVNKFPAYDQERLRIREKYPSKIITGVEPGSAIVPSWRRVEPVHHVAKVEAPSLGGTSIESSRDFSL